MKKELPHFYIGESYGGNQEWFKTFMMRLGGCGAETACDLSIYLAREFGIAGIYPFDAQNPTRADYVAFGHMMEKYLWPRRHGINKLSTYIDGYSNYLADAGVTDVTLSAFPGDSPYAEAEAVLRAEIDSGRPVVMLMLRHSKRQFRDYIWHWFIINGYDLREDGSMFVKTVTYSEYKWLNFRDFWDTGFEERGGLVLVNVGPNA